MKRCSHCGRPNPNTRLRCRTCGYSFVKSWQIILLLVIVFVIVLAIIDYTFMRRSPAIPTANQTSTK